MSGGRRLVAYLIALAFTASPAAAWAVCANQGKFVPANAIKWEPDYAKRTITVTVTLAFYKAGGCGAGTSCEVSPAAITAIVKAIKAYWSGQKYKCFDLIVDVKTMSVGQQSDVCDEAIDIALDDSPINPRDFTTNAETLKTSVLGWSSDDPKDRLRPSHNPAEPSQWKASGRPGDYGHEFGHILGLHDNYDENNKTNGPLPGQAENLMTRAQGHVDQVMVDRAVKRSGMVDDAKILCAWTVSSDGKSVEAFGPWKDELTVKIVDLKLAVGQGQTVSGAGKMIIDGTSVAAQPGCTAVISHEAVVRASGTLVGVAPGALLHLTLEGVTPAGATMTINCPNTQPVTIGVQPVAERYCDTMNVEGPFDLPATGGTVPLTRYQLVGGVLGVTASGDFTVVKEK